MATITENLQTIKDSTEAIKQSIIDKGGTISGDISTWANSVINLPIKLQSINLNHTQIAISQGQVLELYPTFNPSIATNKEISWSSSNNEIATVDNSGKVTAISLGTVTITATSVKDSSVSSQCEVTVEILPETITININQYGSGTYSSKYALDFSEMENLKAYSIVGYDTETGGVTMLRVMTAKAGEGLLIKGEPGDYVVPILESTSFNTLNMLVSTSEAVSLERTSKDGLYVNYKYTLSGDNTEPQFYAFDDGFTLGAGKAYMQVPLNWVKNS